MSVKPILPPEALAQHIAILGKTGSGKTTTAKSVVVEPMLAEGRRVAVVDPTSAWWGLRTSRDGKGPGFPVLVLGGDHGDLPLPALGGAAVARLLVDQGVSLVADTSLLTVGERTRWFIDFAGTLYRLNRAPLHLVLDEAHVFAPQGKVPDPDTGKMLHAANQLAAGGRSRGIRMTMITQRPAKLHKDTLTCADTLIAMRALAPHDRQAVKDWIDGCGDVAQGRAVLDSLAGLSRGEGWVWFPEGGLLRQVKFPPIRTFDSSATPTDGHAATTPKGAAEIDLTEIKSALADAVKEAEANDPRRLRARIAELERLNSGRKTEVDPEAIAKAEQRAYASGLTAGAAQALAGLAKPWDALRHAVAGVERAIQQNIPENIPPSAKHSDQFANLRKSAILVAHEDHCDYLAKGVCNCNFSNTPAGRHLAAAASTRTPATRRQAVPGASVSMPPGERATLTACAQHAGGCTREQLSILTGYKRSTRDAYVQRLREKGFLDTSRDQITATDAGIDALGSTFEPLPTGARLREYWIAKLPEGERKVLQVLIGHYPDAASRETIDDSTGFKRSTRDAYIQRLKARQLVKVSRDGITAAATLFD